MKKPGPPDDELLLFDTPPWEEDGAAAAPEPDPPAEPPRPGRRRRSSTEEDRPLPLPLFPELSRPAPEATSQDPVVERPGRPAAASVVQSSLSQPPALAFEPLAEPEADEDVDEIAWSEGESSVEPPLPSAEAGVSARLLSGLADLAVHGAVLILVLLGERLMGVSWSLDQWPGLTVFLLAFSFLYTVVPLAFWGQTPGMSVAGIFACTEEGENLSFPQTAARWAASLLTVLLAGLPLLLALGGVSLSDRLSSSITRRVTG